MHLKNFSIIIRNGKVELSPAYDFLNSSIIISSKEEVALPLNGKKNNIKKTDIIDYYGVKRMGLSEKIIDSELVKITKAIPLLRQLTDVSFLSDDMKQQYHELLNNRLKRLSLI